MSYELYEFYFKLAYTPQTKTYIVRSNLTITEFIQAILCRARVDFNISPEYDIEIVEAAQFDNSITSIPDANENEMNDDDIIHTQINYPTRRDAEMAPHLINSNMTLKQMYHNCHQTTAFYIRTFINRNTLSIITPENINSV